MPKRIVIVAGEESGDMHAACLVKALLAKDPSLELVGIGGKYLEEAGMKLISDLANYGVTGIVEVLRQAKKIKQAFTAIRKELQAKKPDLLLLVDYPGFNLRLARYAKKVLGLPIMYYISPQIWAWKANRIKTIKAYVDRMAVILPFEKPLFQEAGIPVAYVGHPLLTRIPNFPSKESLRQQFCLPLKAPIVALLPGSRQNEIQKHMPILIQTVKIAKTQYTNIHFVIPASKSINLQELETYCRGIPEITIIPHQALAVMSLSDAVLVASGTASLECALLGKPMCVFYKSALFTYILAMKLIKVKYLSLCNLLENSMIVPELLQYDCNPDSLSHMIGELLYHQEKIQSMQQKLTIMKERLSVAKADKMLVDLVLEACNT